MAPQAEPESVRRDIQQIVERAQARLGDRQASPLGHKLLQGVLIVQTVEARIFLPDEIRMLSEAAAQVGPVVSEARTLDRFIAPAQEKLWSLARNLWWSWDSDSTAMFRDLEPVPWRQFNHNPISLLGQLPLGKNLARARLRPCLT